MYSSKLAYGLTELSPAACISKDTDPYGSIGQPLPNTRIKIVDENGNIKSAYQEGEICVQGPQVFNLVINAV